VAKIDFFPLKAQKKAIMRFIKNRVKMTKNAEFLTKNA